MNSLQSKSRDLQKLLNGSNFIKGKRYISLLNIAHKSYINLAYEGLYDEEEYGKPPTPIPR